MFEKFIAAFIGAKLGKLAEFEPLSKHTTLRVGGPARIFVQPVDKTALGKIITLANDLKILYKILGKGSNLLVSDEVFEGVVIQMDKTLTHCKMEGTKVRVGAGVSDVLLARSMAKAGFSGLEFLSGVPGTIGGAVFMNAGAYNKEVSDIIVGVEILDEYQQLRWLEKEELELSYRSSIFQRRTDWVIVEVLLQLEVGSPAEIMETMNNRKEKRKASQPLEFPSAGSAFRNPEGHFAWELISAAGLRGYQVGGAGVSTKHTNFVINLGGATANDVATVITHVKETIKARNGLEMHQEVEFFNWSTK